MDISILIREILSTERDALSGHFAAQLGDAVTGEVTETNAEIWQQPGFASTPPNPTAGVAAQALCLAGDVDQCIAYRDERQAAVYGALGPGESCVFAMGPEATGTARMLLKDDGSKATVSIVMNAGNASDGVNFVFTMDTDGTFAWLNEAGGLSIGPDGAISLMNQNGGIQVSAEGNVTLMGPQLSLAGQAVALGIGASPATPALMGMVGVAGVASKSVLIAP